MNVASLELCKELYELSVWETGTTGFSYHNGSIVFGWVQGSVPAYTLGYLLRKLPFNCPIAKGMAGRWVISRYNDEAEPVEKIWGDTPEDAACRLAIELFRKGVLE